VGTDAAQRTLQFGAGVSRVLECPKGMVGRVIGKGGETIKALQKQYSCNIQIEQNSDPMTITIAGQPHTVDPCAAAVQEIIAGGNPFGANAPPNFAGGASLGAVVLCSHP
jgi:far upstream element-binding protein